MKITILAWRDHTHSEAGGSERYVAELASGFAKLDHQVTLITSRPKGSPAWTQESTNFEIRRIGNRVTVFFKALLVLKKNKPEVVIEVVNGVPFFSKIMAPKLPVICLVHHVHKYEWQLIYPGLIGKVGTFLETKLFPKIYQNQQIVTVSAASKSDLISIGFKPQHIEVIHNGTPKPSQPPTRVEKSAHPKLIVISRLVPQKQIDHAIRLVAALQNEFPRLRLEIVGAGWKHSELAQLCEELSLTDRITFHGYLNENQKNQLLSSSWILLSLGKKEGWGLSVMEAANLGVPSIGYETAGGITEAILHMKTGILCAEDPAVLSQVVRELLLNKDQIKKLAEAAKTHSAEFTWSSTISKFEELIKISS